MESVDRATDHFIHRNIELLLYVIPDITKSFQGFFICKNQV